MVDVPERNVSKPRKALSFLFPSSRAWSNNNDQKRSRKVGRNSSFGYFSTMTTSRKSQDSNDDELEQETATHSFVRKDTVSSSESSIDKLSPNRMTFRVMNPDDSLSTDSSNNSITSNKSKHNDSDDDDDDDDEDHEVIHYQTHQDDHQQQEEEEYKTPTVLGNDVSSSSNSDNSRGESSHDAPVFIPPSSPPPPPPTHALSTPPSTASSSLSSPDPTNARAQQPGNSTRASGHWYAQGWKIAGQRSNSTEKKNRQSKIMEEEFVEEESTTPPLPPAIKTTIVLGTTTAAVTGGNSSAASSSSSPTHGNDIGGNSRFPTTSTTPSLSPSSIPYYHGDKSRSSLDTFRQPSSSDGSPFPSPILGKDVNRSESTKIENPPTTTTHHILSRPYNTHRPIPTNSRPRPMSPSSIMPMIASSSNSNLMINNSSRVGLPPMGYQPLSPANISRQPAAMTPTYARGSFIQNNNISANKKPQKPTTQFSKFAKASYSLINHPDAIKIYRSMAEKTGDPTIQLSYAKYLLEISELYGGGGNDSKMPTTSSARFSNERGMSSSTSVASFSSSGSGDAGRAFSMDGGYRSSPRELASSSRVSLDSIRSAPGTASSAKAATVRLSESERRKKKMLEDEGVRWVKLLAKQNMGEAAYIQATWYDKGHYGFSKNTSKALKLYRIAANEGIPEAMYAVAASYEKSGDIRNAFINYKNAAAKGVVEAVYRMAKVHLHGEFGQRQNMSTGLELLSQAAEGANEACPDPPYLFGLILTNTYPKADIPTEVVHRYGGELAALRYFEHAAQLGYIHAECRIAFIYEYGLYGAPMHLAKSFGYYDSAARRNNHPQAMLGLSRLYNRGCRGPNDRFTEEERLARDVSGWLAATIRNEDAAFSWCQKAADRGLDEAMFLLGWYYETGIGVPRDFAKAQEYYRRASAKGHKAAAERLYKTNSVTRLQHEDTRRSIRPQSTTCNIM